MSNYSKENLLNKIENALRPKYLYQKDFVNYKGKNTKDERYSEILSEFLLENRTLLDRSIRLIRRENSYKVKTHTGKSTTGRTKENSPRKEEHIALEMYNKTFNYVGKVLDYQIPLKNKKTDKIGKIDLLSHDNHSLYILELKCPGSDETLLRCILEIYTYWKTVDQQKLITDFGFQNIPVHKGILIWGDCQAYKDFNELPKTKKLTQLLEVDVYVLENENNPQIISKL
jgi:hypothetical protein